MKDPASTTTYYTQVNTQGAKLRAIERCIISIQEQQLLENHSLSI